MLPKPRGRRPNSYREVKGESPLKYIMSVLLSDFEYFIEKMFGHRHEFGFPFLVYPNSCQEAELLVPKLSKSAAL